MPKSLRLILFAVSLFLLSVNASQAVVGLVDTESTGLRDGIDNNITSGIIASGSGAPGDFELVTCGTFSDGNNSFLDPAPGDWTTIESGECGGSGQCILGIFGRFDDSAASSDISCNWIDPTDAFAAGSFRYRGVDPASPVITSSCNTGGPQTLMTAPSVDTEAGSAVIFVFSLGTQTELNPVVFNLADPVFQGEFSALGGQEFGEQTFLIGASVFFPEGGSTGDFPFIISPNDWRACTIALRMEPTNIPTLSEWGLGIFAALFGIAAVWALRRRAARA